MARFLALAGIAMWALAGCATTSGDQHVASAECKVHLADGTQPAGGNPNETALDQQRAVAQLSALELKDPRFRGGPARNGPIQEALRDCR